MPINSRAKGKRGELAFASFLREHGFADARRGRQFHGGQDSPDVVGVRGIHFEVKCVQAGNPYSWLAQACAESGLSVPVVAHKRNGKEWIAVLRADDLLTLIKRARI
jgi:Holliday junction resolvase